MRKLIVTILRFVLGRLNGRVASPEEFTRECADVFSMAEPRLKVSVERDLMLRITAPDGRESTSFLDNLYETCRLRPRMKRETIARFVAGSLETLIKGLGGVDRTRIVPVIKDRGWLADMRQSLMDRGAQDVPDPVYEEFSKDLVIVYAVDSENSIAFLQPSALEEAKIAREELRVLAASNLKRLLPKIERAGVNGIFMFMAGGTYEASLLLLDTIWAGIQAEVQGEVVVAIPTRDVLVATGSKNTVGMTKVIELVQSAWKTGPYRLTPQLLVYRDGQFQEYGVPTGEGLV